MFKGITIEEFNQYFVSEESCRQYLFEQKWKNGYRCRRCGCKKFWNGRTQFHARCVKCDYDESVTAHTIFHKIQIPLLKAFSISFHLVILKKGISTNDLSKAYGINQKTAWVFKRKIQTSMRMVLSPELNGKGNDKKISLDSIVLTHRPSHANGLQRVNLTTRMMRIKKAGPDILWCAATEPMISKIDPCQLVAGKYVDAGKNIQLWNFKVWLTGIHHHCSEKFLQGYLDEYFFRCCFRHRREIAWHQLIRHIVHPGSIVFNGKAA